MITTDPISVACRSDERVGHLLDTAILNKVSLGRRLFAGVAITLFAQAFLASVSLVLAAESHRSRSERHSRIEHRERQIKQCKRGIHAPGSGNKGRNRSDDHDDVTISPLRRNGAVQKENVDHEAQRQECGEGQQAKSAVFLEIAP